MSQPKSFWYIVAVKVIQNYNVIKNSEVKHEKQWADAIEKALVTAGNKDNGKYRLKAIDMVLIRRTHTESGAGGVLHYSQRSIKYFINEFVNDVIKNVGAI